MELPLRSLGEVREAELYFSHEVKLAPPEPKDEELDADEVDYDERPVDRTLQLEAARDHRSQETVKPAPPDLKDEELAEDEVDHYERPVDRTVQHEAARGYLSQETVKLLTSLRMAAWIIAALLFVRLFL